MGYSDVYLALPILLFYNFEFIRVELFKYIFYEEWIPWVDFLRCLLLLHIVSLKGMYKSFLRLNYEDLIQKLLVSEVLC